MKLRAEFEFEVMHNDWPTASKLLKTLRKVGCVTHYDVMEIKGTNWLIHDDGSVTCVNCTSRMSSHVFGYGRCPRCGARLTGKKYVKE